jgi:hypothetical protein
MHDRTLLDRIIKYSGNAPGTGALMTWVDSGWLMSVVVPYQPHFPGMPAGTCRLVDRPACNGTNFETTIETSHCRVAPGRHQRR